jgi:hypothetical protein
MAEQEFSTLPIDTSPEVYDEFTRLVADLSSFKKRTAIVKPKLNPIIKRFRKSLEKVFDKFHSDFIAQLDKNNTLEKLYKDAQKQQLFIKTNQPEIPAVDKEFGKIKVSEKGLTTSIAKYATEGFNEGGKTGLQRLGFDISFDLKDPNILEAIKDRANLIGKDVRDNIVFSDLKRLVAQGLYYEGMSPSQIVSRIGLLFKDSITPYRADRIARTESLVASEFGLHQTYLESGVPEKKWEAILDMATRPEHRAAHYLLPIKTDEPYIVGGEKMMFPGDQSLGATVENIVNCRCDSVPIVPKGKEIKPWQGEKIK